MICSDCEQFPVIYKVIRTRPISPLPLAGEGEEDNGIELPSFK